MPKDPIKAMKKAARDLELEMGVRFTYNHPHKSKKVYNRKNKSWKKDSGSCYFLFLKNLIFTIKPLKIAYLFTSPACESGAVFFSVWDYQRTLIYVELTNNNNIFP